MTSEIYRSKADLEFVEKNAADDLRYEKIMEGGEYLFNFELDTGVIVSYRSVPYRAYGIKVL